MEYLAKDIDISTTNADRQDDVCKIEPEGTYCTKKHANQTIVACLPVLTSGKRVQQNSVKWLPSQYKGI